MSKRDKFRGNIQPGRAMEVDPSGVVPTPAITGPGAPSVMGPMDGDAPVKAPPTRLSHKRMAETGLDCLDKGDKQGTRRCLEGIRDSDCEMRVDKPANVGGDLVTVVVNGMPVLCRRGSKIQDVVKAAGFVL